LLKKNYDNFSPRIHGKWQISHFQNFEQNNFPLIDLDQKISEEINYHSRNFEKKEKFSFEGRKKNSGIDLGFRRNVILSLGGGTPVYYNNMEMINQFSKSIFLRASVTLTERSCFRRTRPLIARLDDKTS
jgi:shikimate kinase